MSTADWQASLGSTYNSDDLVFTGSNTFRLKFTVSDTIKVHAAIDVSTTPLTITSLMVNPSLKPGIRPRILAALKLYLLKYSSKIIESSVNATITWLELNLPTYFESHGVLPAPPQQAAEEEEPQPTLPPSPQQPPLPPPARIDYRGFILSWPIWHNLPLEEKREVSERTER